jgi:hypothetical protein
VTADGLWRDDRDFSLDYALCPQSLQAPLDSSGGEIYDLRKLFRCEAIIVLDGLENRNIGTIEFCHLKICVNIEGIAGFLRLGGQDCNSTSYACVTIK